MDLTSLRNSFCLDWSLVVSSRNSSFRCLFCAPVLSTFIFIETSAILRPTYQRVQDCAGGAFLLRLENDFVANGQESCRSCLRAGVCAGDGGLPTRARAWHGAAGRGRDGGAAGRACTRHTERTGT